MEIMKKIVTEQIKSSNSPTNIHQELIVAIQDLIRKIEKVQLKVQAIICQLIELRTRSKVKLNCYFWDEIQKQFQIPICEQDDTHDNFQAARLAFDDYPQEILSPFEKAITSELDFNLYVLGIVSRDCPSERAQYRNMIAQHTRLCRFNKKFKDVGSRG